MSTAWTTTGIMKDRRTVTLDEELPPGISTVRVVVEKVTPTRQPNSFLAVLAEIHAKQKARGHKPPTAEEVDAQIAAERDSWGD